jgi:hypothetical protein
VDRDARCADRGESGQGGRPHRTPVEGPVRVLGLAQDGDADAVRRTMARHGHRFPVTLDAQPLRNRLTARRIVPMTCVIDRQGRLKQAPAGEMAEADVLELVRLATAMRP